jgi:hypothetical protein
MNLVLVGTFLSLSAAEAAVERMKALQVLAEEQWNADEWRRQDDRMSDEVLEKLRELKLYDMGRVDVDMYSFEHTVDRNGATVTIATDESDVQGFLKVLIGLGAKVEVFSRHDWNDDGTVRRADEDGAGDDGSDTAD